ncbi:MAG: VWA domain-containing protein [FCB group bacterium]|nr:VWA domain-containing protein [FCB group bacterium]
MNWRYPIVLGFFVVWGLLWIALRIYNKRHGKLFNQSSELLINNLLGRLDFRKQKWKQRLGYWGIMFLIIATAGPQVGTRVKPVERKGIDLIFAIDVSASMNAEDVKPNRLEKAKYEVAQIIKSLKGDRVGLIVFAGSSHMYLPLTTDYEAALLFLDAIDTKMIPTQGTALGAALKSGISAFPEESEKYKVLVLVTDGEDHEGEAVAIAKQAAKTGIVIHTVGVGTVTGSLIPIVDKNGNREYKRDRQGKLVTSVLNEDILREIASAGGGVFIRFDNRSASYKELLSSINSMEKRTISTHEFAEYEDRYQIFGVFALVCFVIAYMFPTKRKRGQVWRGRFV